MIKRSQMLDIIDLFSDATGCHLQHNGCPCNSCFHNLEADIDWQHICWLLVLAIRGDYNDSKSEELIHEGIKKELFK